MKVSISGENEGYESLKMNDKMHLSRHVAVSHLLANNVDGLLPRSKLEEQPAMAVLPSVLALCQ